MCVKINNPSSYYKTWDTNIEICFEFLNKNKNVFFVRTFLIWFW